jgi:hypothetical protein
MHWKVINWIQFSTSKGAQFMVSWEKSSATAFLIPTREEAQTFKVSSHKKKIQAKYTGIHNSAKQKSINLNFI